MLIDDLIVTGGISSAACNSIEKLGGEVVEAGFVIELPDLKEGRNLKIWDRKFFLLWVLLESQF